MQPLETLRQEFDVADAAPLELYVEASFAYSRSSGR